MMLRLLKFAVLAAVFMLLLCAEASAQQGRAIFQGKGNCSTCHGANARGTPLGPDLTDAEWLNIDGSLDSIRVIVERGVAKPKRYPAPMPALGGAKLSRAEVQAVAEYVYSLREPGPGVPEVVRRSR